MSNAEGTAAELTIEQQIAALHEQTLRDKARAKQAVEATDGARKLQAAKRRAEAQRALADMAENHAAAPHRVIYHKLPEWFGGGVVMEMPSMERWGKIQDIYNSSARELTAADCRQLVQEITVHPPLPTLSQWETDYFPGLANSLVATVGSAIGAASGDEDQLGKS